jgi:tRNA G10  N-methylase Trm11
MDYLIRLVQLHESFRKPELESLAVLNQLDFKITRYEETVCPLHNSQFVESSFIHIPFY